MMCWSAEASIGLAGAGFGVAVYAHKKGLPRGMSISLAYFALMELLQGATYSTLNQCNNPYNQIFTILSYYHIAFQPFFINLLLMEFIPKWLKEKIQLSVYILCGGVAIIFLLAAYPFAWAEKCDVALNMALCGEVLCSRSGAWHLSWSIPINFFDIFQSNSPPWNRFEITQLSYFVAVLIVPLLYGAWKIALFTTVFGPFVANLMTTNNNEWAAIWCLLSTIFILIILIPTLRKKLTEKSYYGLIK